MLTCQARTALPTGYVINEPESVSRADYNSRALTRNLPRIFTKDPKMAFIQELVDTIRGLIQDLVEALAPARPQVAVQPVRSDDERIFRA
jgi:hypothetical protein